MKIIFFLLLVGFTSCSVLQGTRQNLSISYKLHEGMTKHEVEAIMGQTVKSDFYKKIEEWHYCTTGSEADELLPLFFFDDRLIAKKKLYRNSTRHSRNFWFL
jgi:outer membrane protein assembly factor BamE (lipoprotein component of BamABCDE complex)